MSTGLGQNQVEDRWWNYVTGEDCRRISATADAETMFGAYARYHTLSPDEAVVRLKEAAT